MPSASAQTYLDNLWELLNGKHLGLEGIKSLRRRIDADAELSQSERASLLAMLEVVIDEAKLSKETLDKES